MHMSGPSALLSTPPGFSLSPRIRVHGSEDFPGEILRDWEDQMQFAFIEDNAFFIIIIIYLLSLTTRLIIYDDYDQERVLGPWA